MDKIYYIPFLLSDAHTQTHKDTRRHNSSPKYKNTCHWFLFTDFVHWKMICNQQSYHLSRLVERKEEGL